MLKRGTTSVDKKQVAAFLNMLVASTDGYCLGNPGPCGAYAVIFFIDDPSGSELNSMVAARGSILFAELNYIANWF